MKELFARLREERLVMATQKGLTGLDGKIGVILKHMGEPIWANDGASIDGYAFQQTPMEDVWAMEDEEEMQEYDEDSPSIIGWLFDGLSRGIHMEIRYLEHVKELTLSYKGYRVYCEEGGELTSYVPGAEWEEKVEYLFKLARKREVVHMKELVEEERQEEMREKMSLLDKIKRLWGTS